MKAKILAASLLALSSAAFAADVAMSVSVGQPGFYGRIDIGGYPQPQLVYAQPVLVQRPVRYVESAPIYLRVPPGHRKNWSRHCGYYNACGQRVLFVQDGWYTNNYAPHYRASHGHGHGGRGPEHHGRPDDRRDHHRDDHRGPGPGRGHGGDHRGDHGDRGDNHGDHRGPGRRD